VNLFTPKINLKYC